LSAAALRIGVLTQASHLLTLGPHFQNGPILGTQHIHSHIVVCGSTMGVNYGWFNYGGLTTGGLTMGVNYGWFNHGGLTMGGLTMVG
jgi:hypothetical protein